MANKNIKLNIKIIKALSVGISATMVAQPLTAFANTPGTSDGTPANNTTETQTTEANATAQAQEAAATASAAVGEYESSVASGAEVANSIDASATTSDFAQAVEDINNDLAPTDDHHSNDAGNTGADNGGSGNQAQGNTDNGSGSQAGQNNETEPEPDAGQSNETEPEPDAGQSNETEPEPEGGQDEETEPEPEAETAGQSSLSSALGTASDALGDIADKETEMQAHISAADRINAAADELADAGDALADRAEVIADAAVDAVEDAADSVSEGRQSLSGASTTDQANEAFDSINSSVSAADAAVASAEAQLAEIETEFNAKKAEYDEKAAAYVGLTEQLEQAKADYEALKGTAGSAVEEAAEKLGILTQDAAELKAAAEAAQAEYQSAGFGLISELETEIANMIANGKTPEWRSSDSSKVTYAKLFDAIVEFYYVPEVEGAEFVSAKWSRFSGTFADGSTYSDVLNYCTVKYRDAQGNEYTKLLNYKVADANSQKGKNGEYSGLVIFEKTEHIVYDGTDLTEAELTALDAGEIVEKNGDIIVKNNKGKYVGYNTEDGNTVDKVTETDTENLVIEDGTQIVDILEETASAGDYSYDKKSGKVSQTTTADVAVTTYTGARLDAAAETFADEAGAKAQFVADMQNKIDNLGEGESIVIGEGESAVTYVKGDTATEAGFEASEAVTSYTVSGTFIETYTKDYDTYNGELDYSNGSGWLGLGQLFGIGENHDTARVGEPTSNDNGGVTVEYGNLVKADDIDFSVFGNLFSGGKDEEALKAALTEKYAEEGKIFAGFDGIDWKGFKATVYIIDNSVAESATAATEEAAYQAFEDAIRAGITDGGQLHSVKTSITENKSYGYKLLEYFVKTVAVENQVISETTWNKVAATAQTQYKNDNWYSGDIILSEYDRTTGTDYSTDKGNKFELDKSGEDTTSAFRQKIDNAADTAAKYADLISKLNESEKKVSAAEEAVSLLKESIGRIGFNGTAEELASFEASLKTAQDTLDAAKAGRDTLLSQIADIRTELNAKISALNPVTGNTSDEAPTVTVEEEAPVLSARPATTQVASINEAAEETDNAAEATVEETAGTEETGADESEIVETAAAEGETASIGDEDTAKSAGPAIAAEEDIADADTALASMPETQKMNLWWTLIVLILGTTGAEMYRRHLEKKSHAKQITTSGDK